MNKHIIWLVDDDEEELTTYGNELKLDMSPEIQIKAILPYPRKTDYVSTLLEDPDTACIIIDQKLKEKGSATYTGIELAQYLRRIKKKIPIYILTNFPHDQDEFAGGKWSVEDIISKGSFRDEEEAQTAKARIMRHMKVYGDILDERAKRFNELLKKSLDDSLNEAELDELAELQAERIAPTLAKDVEELQKLERIAKTNEKLIELLTQNEEEESTDAN